MTIDREFPLDANEADVVGQRQPVIDDDDVDLPDALPLVDADPADALDQHLSVPIDDEDWPIE